MKKMRMVAVVILLQGCAAGDGPATNGAGNFVVNGPFTIIKNFGSDCHTARSGITSAGESGSQLGGDAAVSPTTTTVSAGGSTAAEAVDSLAALDECLGKEELKEGSEQHE